LFSAVLVCTSAQVITINNPYLRRNGYCQFNIRLIKINMASTATTVPAAPGTATNKNYVYIISVLGLLFFMLGFITC